MKNTCPQIVPKKPMAGRFFAGLIGGLICMAAVAEQTLQPVTYTMHDAVSLTLDNHPDLKVFANQSQIIKGRITQAAMAQRPQIGLMVEDAMGTGSYSAVKSMQTTLTYSWILEQAQIDSRVKAIQSEADKVQLDKEIKALDLAAITARQYIEIMVKSQRLSLSELAVVQAKEVLEAIDHRIAAGKSSDIERKLAQAELIRRDLAVEDLEHDIKSAKYQLSALWGEPSTDFTLSGNLMDLPIVPDEPDYARKLSNNPAIQRFASAQRIAQAQIERAKIEARPQWQFSAGIRRYEATDDFGFVAGVSIPWGNSDYNAGTTAALTAEQAVLAGQQQSLLQQLDAELFVLLQEMQHSLHVIATVEKQIIPTLESALDEARQAFEKGQLNYSQWSELRRELLAAQSQLLDAYLGIHLQHIEIQRLTGTSLAQ